MMFVTSAVAVSNKMDKAERGDANSTDPPSQNSVTADQTDQAGRRHSMGPFRGSQQPGLRKSRSTQSMILRRTGSTATTSRPYDWRPTRSYVGVSGGGQLPLSRSGKSLTSVRTRATIISRKDYHEDLKPTIVAVSLFRCLVLVQLINCMQNQAKHSFCIYCDDPKSVFHK